MGQPPRKSGCGKIILILAIILLVLGGGVAVAIYFGYQKLESTLKSSEAYTVAVNRLKENEEVKNQLGEIKDTGFPLGAYNQRSDGSGDASFVMSVQGTKDSGRYEVSLVRSNSVWRLTKGVVRTSSGKVIDVVGTTACPLIDLPAHSEALLDRVGPQARQTIRRKRRRLELAGRVEYERVATIEGLGAALTTFVQLHQTRWTQKGLGGAFANPRFLAFHQEIAKAFGELGWVRFDFLRLDDDPVAGIYGFSYKARYSFYLPGFDPAVLPQSSPGILLLLRCAEEAIGEGHREFDLLRWSLICIYDLFS